MLTALRLPYVGRAKGIGFTIERIRGSLQSNRHLPLVCVRRQPRGMGHRITQWESYKLGCRGATPPGVSRAAPLNAARVGQLDLRFTIERIRGSLQSNCHLPLVCVRRQPRGMSHRITQWESYKLGCRGATPLGVSRVAPLNAARVGHPIWNKEQRTGTGTPPA